MRPLSGDLSPLSLRLLVATMGVVTPANFMSLCIYAFILGLIESLENISRAFAHCLTPLQIYRPVQD